MKSCRLPGLCRLVCLWAILGIISVCQCDAQKVSKAKRVKKHGRAVAALTAADTTEMGSIDYLTAINGFGDLKLGGCATEMVDADLSFMDDNGLPDSDSCVTYKYNVADLPKINDDGLQLEMVAVRAYQGQVVNIYLFFKKEYGRNILKRFQAAYGDYTGQPGDFMYDWNAAKINLQLRFKPQYDLGVAIFTGNDLIRKIEEDKLKLKEVAQAQNTLTLSKNTGGY